MTTQNSTPDLVSVNGSKNGSKNLIECPPGIERSDWMEWVSGSGVDAAIVAANVQSYKVKKQIANLIGWKQYNHEVGWFVRGVNWDTGKAATTKTRDIIEGKEGAAFHRNGEPVEVDTVIAFGQFKPIRPIVFKEGDKPVKYIAPKGAETKPIFLDVPGFSWVQFASSPTRRFAITEGAKKAGALMSEAIKLPTIALVGVWNGQVNGRVMDELVDFLTAPDQLGLTTAEDTTEILMAFDMDMWSNPAVIEALWRLGNELKRVKAGVTISVMQWDRDHKGIDDLKVEVGDDAVLEAVQYPIPFDELIDRLPDHLKPIKLRKGEKRGKGKESKAVAVGVNGADRNGSDASNNVIVMDSSSHKNSSSNGSGKGGGKRGASQRERKTFEMISFEELYDEVDMISLSGEFYRFNGIYYVHVPKWSEERRIWEFLNEYSYFDDEAGELVYPYAKLSNLTKALDWARKGLAVDPDKINPPGHLLCTNGVLKINWDKDNLPSWELLPHSKDYYFTYEPNVAYDPKADRTHADRLLECVYQPHLDIFLKTLAASLDYVKVKSVIDRAVKCLFLQGGGNNGKDTVRNILNLMFGKNGMVGATLNDFRSYDAGRKFDLSKLLGANISWASETTSFTRIETIQSLKAAITCDPLSYERKGVDEIEFTPRALLLFNCNELPAMGNDAKAMKSRFAVVKFDKTYTSEPVPLRGELQGDPRFRGNIPWIKENVLSGFLNILLDHLVKLMRERIDFDPNVEDFQEMQASSNHVLRFFRDAGIEITGDEGDQIKFTDLYDLLQSWYLREGYVEETSRGVVYHEPEGSRLDKLVKSPPLFGQKLKKISGRITSARVNSRTSDRGATLLLGLRLTDRSIGELKEAFTKPVIANPQDITIAFNNVFPGDVLIDAEERFKQSTGLQSNAVVEALEEILEPLEELEIEVSEGVYIPSSEMVYATRAEEARAVAVADRAAEDWYELVNEAQTIENMEPLIEQMHSIDLEVRRAVWKLMSEGQRKLAKKVLDRRPELQRKDVAVKAGREGKEPEAMPPIPVEVPATNESEDELGVIQTAASMGSVRERMKATRQQAVSRASGRSGKASKR